MARRRRRTRTGILTMLETTPARVASPLAPPEVDEPLPDEDVAWEPRDLPRAVRSRRRYRIPVVLVALAAAAAVYAAGHYALRLPLAAADDHRAGFTQALRATDAAIPGLRTAAAAVTSPHREPLGLPAVLAGLEDLADDLAAAADDRAALVVPGIPTDDLDALEPLRGRLDAIAGRVTSIRVVLTEIATYRSALAGMFVLPDLPDASEGPSVDLLADRLSVTMADTVEAAGGLSGGPFLAGHRAGVDDLLDWFPGWQAAYLEALRDDDLARADGLRAEAEERIEWLQAGLEGPLAEAAAWIDAEIDRLEADVAAALVLTG